MPLIFIPILLNQFIELEINKDQDIKNKSQQIQDEGDSEEKPSIEITHIKFNHIGPEIKEEVVIENTTDSLYMRKSFKESLKHRNYKGEGEWVKSLKRNEPALYLINIKPIIKVRLKVNKLGLKSAKIKAVGKDSKIPNVIEKIVAFDEKGISVGKDNTQYVEFQLDKPISKTISKTIGNFKWVISGNPENNEKDIDLEETGPHTFYTVLDRPTSPWNTIKKTQRPWESALNFSIIKAGTKGLSKVENISKKITDFIYSSNNFNYDTKKGESQFYKKFLLFNLTKAIGRKGQQIVNCDDVSLTITSSVTVLGIESNYTDIIRFGYIKRASFIGIKKQVNSAVDREGSGLDTCIHGNQTNPPTKCDDDIIYDLPPHQRHPFIRHSISEIKIENKLYIYDACVGTKELKPHIKVDSRPSFLRLTRDKSTARERDPYNNPYDFYAANLGKVTRLLIRPGEYEDFYPRKYQIK